MGRISKENYYLDIAETVLERATCLRRVYGAIIVKNDEIISIARNEETDEDDAEQAAAENGAVQNDAAVQSQAETTTENSAETGTEATSDAGDGENVEA